MNNPFTLTFKLKQHTPIIHFQHEQAGATLRATEVKPKLDRFIITSKGADNIENNWKGKWENTENGIKSILYKMSVTVIKDLSKDDLESLSEFEKIKEENGQQKQKFDKRKNEYKFDGFNRTIWERNTFPTFFGNLDKETERKEIRMNELIEVTIVAFSLTLINYIKAIFPEFVSKQNFGSRQSKGFGSFFIDRHDENFKLTPEPTGNYRYTINVANRNNLHNKLKEVFTSIDLIYKTLRSGLNLKERDKSDKVYFKSMMFKYAKQLNNPEQWDKRTIRHHFFFNDEKYKRQNQQGNLGIIEKRTDSNGTVQFISAKNEGGFYYNFRDLLGLSSKQDWIFYGKTIEKLLVIEQEEFSRYKSPITFKPIFSEDRNSATIYIQLSIDNEEIKNATTKVSSNVIGKSPIILKMYPHFVLAKYIEFAIKNFDASKDFELPFGKRIGNFWETQLITDIYTQLKKQI